MLAGAVLMLACGPQPPIMRDVSVQEAYTLSTAGASSPADSGDCGQPTSSVASSTQFHIVQNKTTAVVSDEVGCDLRVRVNGERFFADNVACSLAEDSPLKKVGNLSRTYQHFDLDLSNGTWNAQWDTLQDTNSGLLWSCGIARGLVSGAADHGELLHFSGAYSSGAEQPGDTASCSSKIHYGDAESIVSLSASDSPTISDYGTGCTLDVSETAPGTWSGDGTQCRFDEPVSLENIGVTMLSYQTYTLDLNQGTLTARGMMTRLVAGAPVSFCFDIQATVDGGTGANQAAAGGK
jgi:hypothetical protein